MPHNVTVELSGYTMQGETKALFLQQNNKIKKRKLILKSPAEASKMIIGHLKKA